MGCLTGLRYSDYSRLTAENFIDGKIHIRTKKTKTPVLVPMHRFVKEIITKYNGNLPPSRCIQYFNLAIKKICKQVGLTDLVRIEPFGSTKRQDMDSIFYELKVKLKGKAFGRMYWYSDDNTTIYFEGLRVAYREKKKGFGTKLLEILEKNAMCLGATTSCLWVRKNTWMQEWYKRKGYVEFQDHEDENFVWMKKMLGREAWVNNNQF